MPGPLSLATVVVFALAAAAAGRAMTRLAQDEGRLWAGLALGFAWLGLNKLSQFQERISVRLHDWGIGDPPGLAGIDDAVLLAYGVGAVALLIWLRRALLRHPPSAAWVCVAGGLFAVSFVSDAFGPNHGFTSDAEQWVELAGAGACVVAGVVRTPGHGRARPFRWAEGASRR